MSQLLGSGPQQTWRLEAARRQEAQEAPGHFYYVHIKHKKILSHRFGLRMESFRHPGRVSEKKVSVVGSELVENYTVRSVPVPGA